MSDSQALYQELAPLMPDPRMTADGRIWAFCPVHPDGQKHGKRSLSLHPKYGLTCFAGCEFKAILDGLNVKRFSSNGRHEDESKGKIAAVYEYRDEHGALIAEKARIEYLDGRKQFKWRLPGGSSRDGLGDLRMRDMPLYGADMVAKADAKEPVWFVEGEKAQRAMTLQGFTAVTHGGGAGAKDFGDSLNVLKGRDVILWPDNDAPGREYMSTVAARLRSIALTVRFFTCPVDLAEKGDAHDYFQMGCKPEAITEALETATPPVGPVTEFMADNAIAITVPAICGSIRFDLSDIETAGRRFDAELTITFSRNGTDPYSERVNLLSSSQRTELRRDLDALYGKEYGWVRLLNQAFGLARTAYLSLDRSLDVSDAPTGDIEQFDIDPILPHGSFTMMFGDGSASKTMLACALAFAYCTGQPFLGYRTPSRPVMFVDWEDSFQTFARRIRRLGGVPDMLLGRGLLYYWPANGVPLAQMVDSIKAKVQKDGIGLVIWDSVALGCGGPPEESVSANQFVNATKKIGVTSLGIAHITKHGDDEKPFGSTYWHNSPRRTWFVKRASDEDTDMLDVAMVCRKVNDGRKPQPIPVRIRFEDPNGPIAVERGDFDPMSELAKSAMTHLGRVLLAIHRQGPMSRAELAQSLEIDEDTVRRTMNRAKTLFDPLGDKWGLSQDGRDRNVGK